MLHYMQRTALQGHPRVLSAVITRSHIAKRAEPTDRPASVPPQVPPVADRLNQLNTQPREDHEDDIEHFARFTGDTFYAHLDDEAAREGIRSSAAASRTAI